MPIKLKTNDACRLQYHRRRRLWCWARMDGCFIASNPKDEAWDALFGCSAPDFFRCSHVAEFVAQDYAQWRRNLMPTHTRVFRAVFRLIFFSKELRLVGFSFSPLSSLHYLHRQEVSTQITLTYLSDIILYLFESQIPSIPNSHNPSP